MLRIRSLGFDDATIDGTRILPYTCSMIEDLNVSRDLPPFPDSPMQVLETLVEEAPSDRRWNRPARCLRKLMIWGIVERIWKKYSARSKRARRLAVHGIVRQLCTAITC